MNIAILHDVSDGTPIAEKLAQDLHTESNTIWVDRRTSLPELDVSMVNEVAVKRADFVIVCLTPNCTEPTSPIQRYSRLARLAQKPVAVWQAAPIAVPTVLAYINPISAYENWANGVAILQESFASAQVIEPTTPDAAEDDPYYDILLQQKIVLENLLIRSVFNLQVWETEGLAGLAKAQVYPFTVSDGATAGAFETLWHKHDQQVVVTGPAGAGRSILLMGMAYQSILKRFGDPTALVPHYIQLYRWNGEDSLFSQIMGIDEVLIIMDGLDELRQDLLDANTEMPLDLRVSIWQEIQRYLPTDTPLIISGSAQDYQALAREFDTLPAQLEIQPLSDETLITSLGETSELWQYTANQPILKDVVRLPFYLTLYRAQTDPASLDLSEETAYEIQDMLIDGYVEERASQSGASGNLTTEEILEAMEQVLWDLLTIAKRREYVELWSQNIQQSIGRQARPVMETLLRWGLIIPVREGVARFVHTHVYRYFIFDSLAHRFLEGFASEQQKAILALTRYLEPEALEILLTALASDNMDVVPNAAVALGNLGDAQAIPTLLKAFGEWSGDLQVTIGTAIGQIADQRAVVPFSNVLDSAAEDAVRGVAAWGLGRIGDPQAIPVLQASIEDEDWTVALNSIEALGKLKATEAVTSLVVLLDDMDDDIRRYTVEALGRIGDNRATNVLLNHVEDPHPAVRAEIFRTLQKLGDVSAVEHLIAALDDDDPLVCQTAASSLQELGAEIIPVLVEALEDTESEEIRYSLAQVLGQFGHAAVAPLSEILDSEDAHVRSSVVQALGWIGGNAVLTTLIDLLNNDPVLDVRIQASNALGWVGDATALEVLIANLNDPSTDLVLSVLQVISQLGDETTVEYLEPLLDNPQELIRRRTAEIIAHLEASEDEDINA